MYLIDKAFVRVVEVHLYRLSSMVLSVGTFVTSDHLMFLKNEYASPSLLFHLLNLQFCIVDPLSTTLSKHCYS